MVINIGPVPTRKRRFYEGTVRVVDLIIYAVIAVGGFVAVAATPTSVVNELGSGSFLVWLWGLMLITSGIAGFLGRLSRRWMVETPATVLGIAGTLIYAAVLARLSMSNISALVAMAFTFVASGILARRWLELQLFAATQSGDVKALIAAAVRRKTANFSRHS